MRFKTDENVHSEVAQFLRQKGHDAVTVWDQSLRGTDDMKLAQVCQSESRALLTLDLDFADIRLYPPGDYPGIIVLRLANQSREQVLSVMARLLPTLTPQTLPCHLFIADEQSIRVRGADEPRS